MKYEKKKIMYHSVSTRFQENNKALCTIKPIEYTEILGKEK